MIPIVIILALASLLQTTLLSLDLVVLVLIARAFILDEKSNFWLAFGFGLILALLSGYPLGSLSLAYLLVVAVVSSIRKTPLDTHPLIIVPMTFILLACIAWLEKILFGMKLSMGIIILETILVLPVYLILRFWEERFIPKKDIKLKMGK